MEAICDSPQQYVLTMKKDESIDRLLEFLDERFPRCTFSHDWNSSSDSEMGGMGMTIQDPKGNLFFCVSHIVAKDDRQKIRGEFKIFINLKD
jgi:hypothetical protein